MTESKPIHTIVLDTGAIIQNEPSVSTLLAKSDILITVPEILSEIRDAATRSRVETTLQPFLTLRSPSPASVKFVTDFARKTGDLVVLSKPDILIIALTYEIECERNHGDWRLRRAPGQKRVNGAPPATLTEDAAHPRSTEQPGLSIGSVNAPESSADTTADEPETDSSAQERAVHQAAEHEDTDRTTERPVPQPANDEELATLIEHNNIVDLTSEADINEGPGKNKDEMLSQVDSVQNSASSQEESDSDSGGWITPVNLKKRQAQDAGGSTTQALEPKTMQVAVLTTDFAMQNVILQINLNLLAPSMTRIKQLKTFVLRCHACFQISKDMTKQFCPKCGKPTLTRVSCSTDTNGEFKLHLKKNMQWNHRGDRYSIPKPVHGSSNGRIKGGGKGGWGSELILTEDQKEYDVARQAEKKQKERSLMDEDYLPGILTGDRGRVGGRVRVGAGRNVNARKR